MGFVGKISKTTENPKNKYKPLKYSDLYLIFHRFSILFIDLIGVHEVLQENVTLRREKADWLVAQQELLRKIDKLTREVEGLRKNFNRKTQKKTDETSPTKKTARAAAAAAPDGSRMCDDPHHDADLGHTDPNTFGTKRRKIATRQPRTTTTATATGVRLDITDPADRDRIPADGPDPAGDPA